MRWVRYETNGHPAYGILEGDTVTEVKGDPFAGYERTAIRRPLAALKLMVPVEMREEYDMPSNRVTGNASYSRFRRFQVTADEDIAVPKAEPEPESKPQ